MLGLSSPGHYNTSSWNRLTHQPGKFEGLYYRRRHYGKLFLRGWERKCLMDIKVKACVARRGSHPTAPRQQKQPRCRPHVLGPPDGRQGASDHRRAGRGGESDVPCVGAVGPVPRVRGRSSGPKKGAAGSQTGRSGRSPSSTATKYAALWLNCRERMNE